MNLFGKQKLDWLLAVAISIAATTTTPAPAQNVRVVDGIGLNSSFDFTVGEVIIGSQDGGTTFHGVPNGAITFDFFTNTASDILQIAPEIISIGSNVPGGWYNETSLGTDTNPPVPALASISPQLNHDTFVTTPGDTSTIGPPFGEPIRFADTVHFDTTDSGPQADFPFARVTLIPDENGNASATLRGRLWTSNEPEPVIDDFWYDFSIGDLPERVYFADVLGDEANGLTAFHTLLNTQRGNENNLDRLAGGATIFAPIDAVLTGVGTYSVGNSIIRRSYSPEELNELVPNAGDTFSLSPENSARHRIGNDNGLTYGGCPIVDSYQVDNGWVHSLDCIPKPVPTFPPTSIAFQQGPAFLSGSRAGNGISSIGGAITAVDEGATSAAGGYTFDLTLDSTDDILLVDAKLTVERGTVFNDTDPAHAASDHAPPVEALTVLFPDLKADLWITTPGGTAAADQSSLVGGQTVSHFDTTDDGPQSEFHWASLTLVPDEDGLASATLDVTIQTAGSITPLFNEVTISMGVGGLIPEPASSGLVMTALLGALGLIRRKRG